MNVTAQMLDFIDSKNPIINGCSLIFENIWISLTLNSYLHVEKLSNFYQCRKFWS
jgi:hypothetical protein